MSDTTTTPINAAKKRAMIAGAIVLALGAAQYQFNIIPMKASHESVVPNSFALPTDAGKTAATSTVAPVSMPSTKPCEVHAPVMRFSVWEWNAQMGLFFANGGPVTTCGSLMQQHGVTVRFTRQDDTNKSQTEQVKFAAALAQGADTPADGVQFVTIMGDGAAQYLAAINKLLDKYGHDYRAEVIGAVGYSRGEDGWWGPQTWQSDATAMKGGATAGVLRDGDWNIAQYKLANDGIKNNPDPTTWDPDAMNWFAVDDYLKAAEVFVTGLCEDRPVVRNGKITRDPKHHTCVDGFVTWTPGDVNAAKGRGGVVRLLSTKENVYQMPSVIIGIHKWDANHSKQIESMLAAAFEGGDQVKQFDAALSRAGQASYAIYADQTPAYWVKYYKGVVERDKTQQPVPLGGSTVMNLADNLTLFGLAEGYGGVDASLFKATYEGFGTIVSQQYPALMPTFPKTTEAVNTTFLEALQATMKGASADVQTFDTPAEVSRDTQVAKRDWGIQFDPGQDTFTPSALVTLQNLYNQLVVGGALVIALDGHTDNTSHAVNQDLSERRARAVKAWLQLKAPALFPDNRFVVRGFGDSQPIATNDTPEGRAQNRRVTITLGSK